jgi:transcription factor IIIB subunit 2
VNVFELGHTYLQLVQTLNLRLPLVDPSHYISRFAALLEFGDETHKVATDAIRLVQRFDRDWMTKGRRPAGVCGACLLLAARMNNFRRSVEEIVQVVKIADTTLRKRLDEFRNTPSGALTLTDFRTVWLEDEMDPPAFTKGKERERAEAEAAADEAEEHAEEAAVGAAVEKKKRKKKGAKRGKKRRRDWDNEAEWEPPEDAEESPEVDLSRPAVDAALFDQGILAGTGGAHPPLFLPDPADEPTLVDNTNIDPELLDISRASASAAPSPPPPLSPPPPPTQQSPQPLASTSATLVEDLDADADVGEKQKGAEAETDESPLEASVSAALAEEVAAFLRNEQGTQLADALSAAQERRQAQMEVDDELCGLDEDELDAFILTEAEVKIRERVWVEMNREYLEAIAGTCAVLSVRDRDTDVRSSSGRATGLWRDGDEGAQGTPDFLASTVHR